MQTAENRAVNLFTGSNVNLLLNTYLIERH